MKTIWSQKYDINTLLVNPEKRLSLFGLLNLLQDTAWLHATHLGHGYEEMLREQTGWVLTRQKVNMTRWPQWRETIELKTWIRSLKEIIAIRDFEILVNGEVIGQSTTEWLILDINTRRPSNKAPNLTREEIRADAPENFLSASKIPLKHDLKEYARIDVRNSDLDLNGHVNNTRYAQWILDSISLASLQKHTLHEYAVNFLAETKTGESITVLGGEIAPQTFQFQGLRAQDQKVVFSATMKVN